MGAVKEQAHDYAKPVWDGEERFNGYFKNRNDCLEMYKEIVNHPVVTEASEIGLLLGGDTYEYPLWVALKQPETTIHHVLPGDEAVVWYPECIIMIDNMEIENGQVIEYGANEYQCIWNYKDSNNSAILALVS